ncbi:hypothetical protein [Flavobacterium gelatinilyticum]|uniref:hypothetical protein n=1 Tax=Flavobacterium gelatinilyticum TaxID=3003260 RepID=UPI00248046D3|nr:hypothetical protein [Flavobacterium gelatinilyticum]
MKSLKIFFLFFFACNCLFSQEITQEFLQKRDAKIDSLTKIDFLKYKYKYLDKNYKIKIPKEVYEKTVIEYKFIPERLNKYRDSLGVVLMAEFKDWDAERIAEHRICYTWKRVGHHVWKSEDEVAAIAKKLKIKQPYRLQELLNKNDSKVAAEIQNLRDTLFQKFNKEEVKTMPADKLLLFAFTNNPEVIELKKNAYKNKQKQK